MVTSELETDLEQAPKRMVWWKWRTGYRKNWGIDPPARKMSSMEIESRRFDGDRELVSVSVQIGKTTYDVTLVVITPKDRVKYVSALRRLEEPKFNWTSLPGDKRAKALRAWANFERWLRSSEDVIDGVIERRLLRLFDYMRDKLKIRRTVDVVLWVAIAERGIDKREEPIFSQVSQILIDMSAVLDLYRECRSIQQVSKSRFVGVDDPPRTIWEDDNGLDNADSRWSFAQKRMRHYGFLR